MNILIFTHTFPLHPNDGTAHFMYDFAQGFAERDHEVTVLVPWHPSLKPKEFKGIRVVAFGYALLPHWHRLGFGRTMINNQNLRLSSWILSPLFTFFGFLALVRAIHRYHSDVVNAHWIIPNGFIAALATGLTHTPLVLTLPGTDVFLTRQNFFFKWAAAFTKKRAQAITSNSPQLLEDLDVSGETIPYGVPANNGRRSRNTIPKVAAAGRLVSNKNFALLTEVYPKAEILSGMPTDEFRKKLLSIDIFVAPSIRDNKGNLDDGNVVVLEAMAAGCAVVTSDLPGYRKIIKNNTTGVLVPPGDGEALRRVLKRLLKSQSERKKLGLESKQAVVKYFTPYKIAHRYIEVFTRAITLCPKA